ncbi:MAG TPA: hypothetical protein GXX29_13005 [Firmicutes bacterium]|nr:hypothetical protein [Bacillota bacterium]
MSPKKTKHKVKQKKKQDTGPKAQKAPNRVGYLVLGAAVLVVVALLAVLNVRQTPGPEPAFAAPVALYYTPG